MMYFDERNRIENCGFEVGAAGTTAELGRDSIDGPEWNRARSIFGACGGAVAYCRRMLDEIGFVVHDFFLIYGDGDLNFLAHLRGYSCVFGRRAMVYHRYRWSINRCPA